eukprot:GHRR01023555.1.p3 GENE.GHRR01023555.1~~GHRR01023555.1.p3  ORF type:complete len:118 (+),score=28.99 GHRR01023555.1:262-615(+)
MVRACWIQLPASSLQAPTQCPRPSLPVWCEGVQEWNPNADKLAHGSYLPGWAIAVIIIACVVAVAGVGFLAFLIRREKKCSPYKQWQNNVAGTAHIQLAELHIIGTISAMTTAQVAD